MTPKIESDAKPLLASLREYCIIKRQEDGNLKSLILTTSSTPRIRIAELPIPLRQLIANYINLYSVKL